MTDDRKRICILGSTGSIGENTLRVIGDHSDQFRAVGLAANDSGGRLLEQARAFAVDQLCLTGNGDFAPPDGAGVFRVGKGLEQLIEACAPDLVVVATVGDRLRTGDRVITLRLPLDRGDLVAAAHREGEVLASSVDDEFVTLRVVLDDVGAARFAPWRAS